MHSVLDSLMYNPTFLPAYLTIVHLQGFQTGEQKSVSVRYDRGFCDLCRWDMEMPSCLWAMFSWRSPGLAMKRYVGSVAFKGSSLYKEEKRKKKRLPSSVMTAVFKYGVAIAFRIVVATPYASRIWKVFYRWPNALWKSANCLWQVGCWPRPRVMRLVARMCPTFDRRSLQPFWFIRRFNFEMWFDRLRIILWSILNGAGSRLIHL